MSLKEGLVAMDLDGTVTDPERSRDSFVGGYLTALLGLIGDMPMSELELRFNLAERQVRPEEVEYWWWVNGVPSAPPADFILMTQAAGRKVIDGLQKERSRSLKLLESEQGLSDVLKRAYEAGRAGMAIIPREGAAEFVQELAKQKRLVIVTNSDPTEAERVLQAIVGENEIPKHGGARKFWVDVEWGEAEGVPVYSEASIQFLVQEHLRRPDYYKILQQLQPVSVIGDVRTLDLALPEFLGMYVALAVSSKYTPEWEVRHHLSHSHGTAFGSFDALADKLL